MTDDELTYAEAGVDIAASETATEALVSTIGALDTTTYAGLLDLGDRYLGLTTDGVGTKLLVADAVDDYSTIGIDCIAMNVNDLVASGITPLGFVDYLALETPDEHLTEQIGEGLAIGAEQAEITLVGGETAVMPEVVTGCDLAGACVGIADKSAVFENEAQPGDAIVGWESSGIHSNGLTLARKAVTRAHAYSDPFDGATRTIGETLLTPTEIYTSLLEPMRSHDVHAAAHITGGGWTNLHRLGSYAYSCTDPFPVPPVFTFIQDQGNISDQEMYRTFNMGTGFAATLPPDRAHRLAAETNGRVIGTIEDGEGVTIRNISI